MWRKVGSSKMPRLWTFFLEMRNCRMRVWEMGNVLRLDNIWCLGPTKPWSKSIDKDREMRNVLQLDNIGCLGPMKPWSKSIGWKHRNHCNRWRQRNLKRSATGQHWMFRTHETVVKDNRLEAQKSLQSMETEKFEAFCNWTTLEVHTQKSTACMLYKMQDALPFTPP